MPATIPRRVGRPRGWAPSTIRAMLHRDLYRGVVVWNKRQKLVRQGAKKVRLRSDKEWLSVDAPAFSIVSPKLWQAAHERLTASRSLYLATNKGKSWGRPANGIESPYLLTGLLSCGACGGGMFVHSHDDRHHRRFFYACAAYHLRSRAICKNNLESPMEATDGAVLGSIESDVLRGEVLETSLAKALDILRPAAHVTEARVDRLRSELARLDGEIARLAGAIATGGELSGLLTALQERERRRHQVRTELAAAARDRRGGVRYAKGAQAAS